MADDSSEDDYMTMVVETAPSKGATSSLSRAEQRRKAGAQRGVIKSKRELEEERMRRLERGLRTNLGQREEDSASAGEQTAKSKGAAMLAKLGYKGGPLGRAAAEASASPKDTVELKTGSDVAADTRLVDPIRVQVKNNKFGIGVAAEETPGMKRARAALDEEEARIKRLRGEMGGYRSRRTQEADERRQEGQWKGAMRVVETLVEQRREAGTLDAGKGGNEEQTPLVLKPLLRQKEEAEQLKRVQAGKEALLHRADEGDEEDEDDRVANGETLRGLPEVAGDLPAGDEDEDEALDEYLALPVAERLDRTVKYLRYDFWYCFWCKARYDDAALEGCPGLTEEDHD